MRKAKLKLLRGGLTTQSKAMSESTNEEARLEARLCELRDYLDMLDMLEAHFIPSYPHTSLDN